MNVTLSPEATELVNDRLRSGEYNNPSEVLEEALMVLRERDDKDYREAVEGIRRGIEDAEAGRTQPLAEAFQDIRRGHDV